MMHNKPCFAITLSAVIAVTIIAITGCSKDSPRFIATKTPTFQPTNSQIPTLTPVPSTNTPTNVPTILFTGRIAFVSQRQGSEIYVMNADGSDQKPITIDAGINSQYPPLWSPNGQKIAYVTLARNPEGDYQLWVINSDGSNPIHLSSRDKPVTSSVDWSPDSQQLVFTTGPDVYRVNANGTGLIRLAHILTDNSREWPYAQWLLDGRIAFVSYRQNDHLIYVINPDGSNKVEVDGSVFLKGNEKRVDITKNKISVLNPNGSEVFHMAFTSKFIQQEIRSPDGTKVAFVSDHDGDFEIYVLDITSLSLIQLTNNTAWDADPAWSPDGGRIAYSSDRTGNFEIYIMNSDGTEQTQLTFDSEHNVAPAWQP